MTPGRLLAISDLHVSYPRNRQWVEDLPPGQPGDWLLVAGDVGEKAEDIEWVLRTLIAELVLELNLIGVSSTAELGPEHLRSAGRTRVYSEAEASGSSSF